MKSKATATAARTSRARSSKAKARTAKQSTAPQVLAVICAYNNKAIIDRVIRSVLASDYPRLRVLLVDDCSTDGTADYVEKQYPRVEVIRKKKNTGITTSRNAALALAPHADYVCFLDSDAELTKDALQILVRHAQSDPSIAIIGPKVVFRWAKDRINSAGGNLYFPGYGYDKGFGSLDTGQYEGTQEVFFAIFAAVLVRRNVFDTIGTFDEGITAWGCDDTDLAWRARIAGYRVVYEPSALALHDFHGTVKSMKLDRINEETTKARFRMIIRNWGIVRLLIAVPLAVAIVLAEAVVTSGGRIGRLRGIGKVITDMPQILRDRRAVQSLRRVPDRVLSKYIEYNLFRALTTRQTMRAVQTTAMRSGASS